MGQMYPESPWQINWLRPRLQWNKAPIRPAEIGDGLCKLMMARGNVLEDANYNKVLPNHFVVELSPENYAHHYEPLGSSLIQQWRDRIVDHLTTTNNRLGRKEYRMVGQVVIDLRPVPAVKDSHARVLCRVEPDFDTMDRPVDLHPVQREATAYLEMISDNRRWPLFPGDNTIGRSDTCDIYLDMPLIQEKRLISSHHATFRIEAGQAYLYDGSSSGKPSANGTYVNAQRITEYGILLQEGDVIILASVDPQYPRWDTPGAAAFRFRKSVQGMK
jgi:hypothetical protein